MTNICIICGRTVGLGATFDRDLWHDIGTTIGLEARGLNNMRVGPLYFLDPDINLLRDPRWGRAQEVTLKPAIPALSNASAT